MADILIRGMEMPKDNNAISIIIFSNGKVSLAHDKKYAEYAEAVPLPEGHGRLVDAREVLEKADKAPWFDGDVSELGLLLGSEVTTIIPAEGGTDDGN